MLLIGSGQPENRPEPDPIPTDYLQPQAPVDRTGDQVRRRQPEREERRDQATFLRERASGLTYDQFAQEMVLQKIASDVYNEAKKVTHLRHVGLRKSKLIRMPEGVQPKPQEAVLAAA